MTPEIPPLVVGIDGSERSLDALALAARLADPGQHVLLIHVRRSGRSSNLTALQEFLDPVTAREIRVVSESSPARGLQAIAEEIGASLIVVGSSHRSGIGRVFVGSVAESLLVTRLQVDARAACGRERALGVSRGSASPVRAARPGSAKARSVAAGIVLTTSGPISSST